MFFFNVFLVKRLEDKWLWIIGDSCLVCLNVWEGVDRAHT